MNLATKFCDRIIGGRVEQEKKSFFFLVWYMMGEN